MQTACDACIDGAFGGLNGFEWLPNRATSLAPLSPTVASFQSSQRLTVAKHIRAEVLR